MIVNEMFDTVVFLCIVFIGASAIMGLFYLFYKYVLGIDLDSTY